jgi:hypothetical protein
MGVLAVDFRATARNWWVFLVSNKASFEGRRDGDEGQGAGVVQIGVDGGGNVGKRDVWYSTVCSNLTVPPPSGAPSSARSYRD